MSPPDLLTLRAGPMCLRMFPQIGGAVVDWHRDDAPVFRPVSDDALIARDARQLACFPLLPYSNRIANGRFTWGGHSHQLDHNFPHHPHTIHGVGWQQPWTVVDSTADSARLILDYDPNEAGLYTWPFRLAAEQLVRLSPDGLAITLTVRNAGSSAWPAGLGLHPHFPRGDGADDVRLGFHADRVWARDPDSLPTTLEPIPPEWRFDPPKPLQPPMMDNCFQGWPGRATVDLPRSGPGSGLRVSIEADPIFDHLVVYSPDGLPFCAVEPATHRPDAINQEGRPGLRVLAPGEALSAGVRFAVSDPG